MSGNWDRPNIEDYAESYPSLSEVDPEFLRIAQAMDAYLKLVDYGVAGDHWPTPEELREAKNRLKEALWTPQ